MKLKLSKNSNIFKTVKLIFMSLSIPDTYFSVFVELTDAYRIARLTRWMRESNYYARYDTAVINSDLMKAEGAQKKILREKLGPRDSARNPRAADKISLNVTPTESAASLIGTYSRERRNCHNPTKKDEERGRAFAEERRRKLAAMQITAASERRRNFTCLASRANQLFSRDRGGQTCIFQDRVLRAGITSTGSV